MDYRVPMREVAVQVALFESEPGDYLVYLNPASQRREGPETIDEYLNGPRSFLPMLHEGVAKIVNRDQIVWVMVAEWVTPGGGLDATIVQRLTILELVDGSRLEGYLEVNRPADSSRVSDALNSNVETFVRLNDEQITYFVNKKYVRVAIPR